MPRSKLVAQPRDLFKPTTALPPALRPEKPAKGLARIERVDAVTVGVWALRVWPLGGPHLINCGLLPGVRDDFSGAHQWLHVPRVGEHDPGLPRRLAKRARHFSDHGPQRLAAEWVVEVKDRDVARQAVPGSVHADQLDLARAEIALAALNERRG